MTLEGVIHCDGPDCEIHQHVSSETLEADRLPAGWIRVTHFGDAGTEIVESFCCADCGMKKFAELPPPEEIPID